MIEQVLRGDNKKHRRASRTLIIPRIFGAGPILGQRVHPKVSVKTSIKSTDIEAEDDESPPRVALETLTE